MVYQTMAISSCASAPFDHAEADVILKSVDGVEFRVFKVFLSLASPYFKTLFDLPRVPGEAIDQEMGDGPVVVTMPEDSRTLDYFLRFCYPSALAEDPSLENLTDVLSVLAAARKYSLNLIETKVSQALANPKILGTDPLLFFAIARNTRLNHETITAAKYTLRQPLIPVQFAGIELITASELLALLTYHRDCGVAVETSLKDLKWMKDHYRSENGCGWLFGSVDHRGNRSCCCEQITDRTLYPWNSSAPLLWWARYMRETLELLKDRPSGDTVRSEADKVIQTVRSANCRSCANNVHTNMTVFSNLFASKVEEVVASVELQMDFSQFSSIRYDKCDCAAQSLLPRLGGDTEISCSTLVCFTTFLLHLNGTIGGFLILVLLSMDTLTFILNPRSLFSFFVELLVFVSHTLRLRHPRII